VAHALLFGLLAGWCLPFVAGFVSERLQWWLFAPGLYVAWPLVGGHDNELSEFAGAALANLLVYSSLMYAFLFLRRRQKRPGNIQAS